ncbi:AAA family ATPase [Pseudomonas saudimassiliensis]
MFLYQDEARPQVLPFYTVKRLKWVAGADASGSPLALQERLLSQRGERDVLTFAAGLERLAMKAHTVKPLKESPSMDSSLVPLNQILFGPPGTGKTYATVEAALEVLDPDYLREPLRHRSELKQRFDELVQQDRIRFVTFHQSFSYEDFVEGLRATTDDASGQLRYEVVDGVFKSLCDAAAVKVTQQAAAPNELDQRRVWKMSLGNTLGEDASIYQECVAGGYVLLGYGGSVDFAGCTNRQQVQARFADAGVVPENPATDYGITSVTAFVAKMRVGDLIVVSDGNFKFRAIGEVMGDYQFKPHAEFEDGYAQLRPVKWLRQYQPSLPHTELLNAQFSQMTLYELRSPTLNKDKLQALLAAGTEVSTAPDSRVLIIDEINRGNISRIFGELITLIERSKRAGADEALSVVLPYSKERFSVPDNVYLIGTMNTADRSLAGLDIALRRRFVFREMPPKPELLDSVEVQGLNIGQLLRVMNQRIEVLFDREHCLGHAYFMPLKEDASLARLEGILRNEILPLLQEYFFDDWQRIQWVLNDHRKPVIDRFVQQDTQDLAGLFGDISVPAQGGVWRINDAAFKRISAYRGVLGVPSSDDIPAVLEETGA